MTPTPEQIEVVLVEYEDELTSTQRKLIADRICRLTAATEVGEHRIGKYKADYSPIGAEEIAAEVGEPKSHVNGFYSRKYMDEEIRLTIERCAQVADRRRSWRVAADIRALKDKP